LLEFDFTSISLTTNFFEPSFFLLLLTSALFEAREVLFDLFPELIPFTLAEKKKPSFFFCFQDGQSYRKKGYENPFPKNVKFLNQFYSVTKIMYSQPGFNTTKLYFEFLSDFCFCS